MSCNYYVYMHVCVINYDNERVIRILGFVKLVWVKLFGSYDVLLSLSGNMLSSTAYLLHSQE